MKLKYFYKHLFFALLLLSFTIQSKAQVFRDTCVLIVKVSQLSSDDGQVVVAIHEPGEMFPNYSVTQTKYAKIENGISYIEFKVIKKKDYAVTALHDVNENGILDLGILGNPVETYLISNQAAEFDGLPKFEYAKFRVEKNTMLLELKRQ